MDKTFEQMADRLVQEEFHDTPENVLSIRYGLNSKISEVRDILRLPALSYVGYDKSKSGNYHGYSKKAKKLIDDFVNKYVVRYS